MLRRSPLKAKREKPRRNEGRIVHERMKPRAKAAPTAAEKRHMDHVSSLGCAVPGCANPPVIHHIMSASGKRRRRDHRFVIGLCPEHHNMGRTSVHMLGSEELFSRVHGVDIVQRSIKLWEEGNG